MVVEEEEQGPSESAPISRDDCSSSCSDSSSSSSSSSDSSDESEESEGGGGGEMSKDNPPQPHSTSSASLIPQEPSSTLCSAERKVDALPSATEGSRQLIQELGERVAEELQISQDSSYKAESNCSQLNSAAAKTEVTSGRSSSGTLLEPSPRRNPLLIVQTRQDLDESDFIC